MQFRGEHCNGFVAIHSTRRGPAFGGIRFQQYSSERDALNDALSLSKAMSLKCAVSELPSGGGKSVIIQRPGTDKTEALKEFSEVLNSLEGTYFAGPDIGIERSDLELLSALAPNVACEADGHLGSIAEHTASGVWHAIRACLERIPVARPVLALQGMGAVGSALARIVHQQQLRLAISDIVPERCALASELEAEVIDPEEILASQCSVLAPCAMGGVITTEVARATPAGAICGSANNLLAQDDVADVLDRRGVLFVPDFVSSAGGVIRGVEYYLLQKASSHDSIGRIYSTTAAILDEAKKTKTTPLQVATSWAEARL